MKLEDVYEEVFSLEKEQIDLLQEDLRRSFPAPKRRFRTWKEKIRSAAAVFLHLPHEF